MKKDNSVIVNAHSNERIGVFVCHCGINISETVDVKKVVHEIQRTPATIIIFFFWICKER
ncbi:MAG: hypothetical protein GWO20_19090 [Candidatus Korarchaeota archaeon]|nr:hypothetical protein [Candidatus Korarchaeota archaeon]NIU85362.1 hypothetical protein [Candidatus Thorarchaeota archaeon]NIW15460.1 hypothetical protein [Candidatus Thorarchaeota archaeon]NIW53404.1 hypothetical protein [Candidatus Korarchaeota archaeon]